MIVSINGDENYASTVKGEAFVWKERARQQFHCRGWSTLIFWSNGRGVWCGVEGRRRGCRLLSSKCQLLFPPAVLFTASKVSYDVTLASTTVTNFLLMEGAIEAFRLWKSKNAQGSSPCCSCTLTGAKERQSCLLHTLAGNVGDMKKSRQFWADMPILADTRHTRHAFEYFFVSGYVCT